MGFKIGKTKAKQYIEYKYFPKDRVELINIVRERLEKNQNADLNDIDTSEITDMHDLFEYIATGEINLSNWDVSKVTNMYGMFHGCSKLTKIDLSKWDVSNLENTGFMFDGCSGLKAVNVSTWNTSNLKDTKYMFYKCQALQNIDISNWDVSSIEDMNRMFYMCKNLHSIGNVDNFKFGGRRVNLRKMFRDSPVKLPKWYEDNTLVLN